MTAEAADIALFAHVLNGDEAGLATLLNRHWHSLVRYSTSILKNNDAAEYVVQQVFVRLWERRDEWGLEISVPGLLYGMTRTLSLEKCREQNSPTRAADRDVTTDEILESVAPSQTENPITVTQAALDKLPQRTREVFVLMRQYGLSYRETAEALEMAAQTVAKYLSMALVDLRETLILQGHS